MLPGWTLMVSRTRSIVFCLSSRLSPGAKSPAKSNSPPCGQETPHPSSKRVAGLTRLFSFDTFDKLQDVGAITNWLLQGMRRPEGGAGISAVQGGGAGGCSYYYYYYFCSYYYFYPTPRIALSVGSLVRWFVGSSVTKFQQNFSAQYLGNEKSYRRSAGVKTTGFLRAF